MKDNVERKAKRNSGTKVPESRQPSANVDGEGSRIGLCRLRIRLKEGQGMARRYCSLARNVQTRVGVNAKIVNLRGMSQVQGNFGDRNKETQRRTERKLQARKGQDMAAAGRGQARVVCQ